MGKVAVVGSRDYQDLDRVRRYIEQLPSDTVIVSGGARGVDSVAEKAARARGLDVIIYHPEWEKLGKRAGFIRNKTIVEEADLVVAFWNHKSKGTAHTIDLARSMGKQVIVIPALAAQCVEEADG